LLHSRITSSLGQSFTATLGIRRAAVPF
jgi:hypothetical protein